MRKYPPTPALVIAVLHFVFGGLGLLGAVCGGGILLLLPYMPTPPTVPGQPRVPTYLDFQNALAEKIPGFAAIQYGGIALSLVTAVLMIVAGLGLLRIQPRGRILSIVYAVLSILSTLIAFVFNLLYTMPVMTQVFDETFQQGAMGQMGAQQQQAMTNMMRSIFQMSYYANFLTPVVQMIYPVTVLIIMYLPSVRAAYRAQPEAPLVEVEPDDTDRFEAREG